MEAEVTLYPLGEPHLSHPIRASVKVLEDHGCEAEAGQPRLSPDWAREAVALAAESAFQELHAK